jgi:hypothetical protein
MALTTYSGLKTALANWLNRTDLTSEIADDFIKLAELKPYDLGLPLILAILVIYHIIKVSQLLVILIQPITF